MNSTSNITSQLLESKSVRHPAQFITLDSESGKKIIADIRSAYPDQVIKLFPTKTDISPSGEMLMEFTKSTIPSPQLAIEMLYYTILKTHLAIAVKSKHLEKINSSKSQQVFLAVEELKHLVLWLNVCKKHHIALSNDLMDRLTEARKKVSDLDLDLDLTIPIDELFAKLRIERDKELDIIFHCIDNANKYIESMYQLFSIVLLFCLRCQVDIGSILLKEAHGRFLLIHLIERNETKYIELLLDMGLNPRELFLFCVNKRGFTREMFLVFQAHLTVEQLIYRDDDGNCLLDYAIINRSPYLSEILGLISRQLTASELSGCLISGLYQAIRRVYHDNDCHAFQLIVKYELNLMHVYSNGQTAAEYAENLGLCSVADCLITKGAASINVFARRKQVNHKLLVEQFVNYMNHINSLLKLHCKKIQLAKLYYEIGVKDYSLGIKPWLQPLWVEQIALRKKLLKAVSAGDVQGVITLVENGVDINFMGELDGSLKEYLNLGCATVNVYAMPPLFFSALYSDKPVLMFKLLLELGASVIVLNNYTQQKYSQPLSGILPESIRDPILRFALEHMDLKPYENEDQQYRARQARKVSHGNHLSRLHKPKKMLNVSAPDYKSFPSPAIPLSP